MHMPNHETGDVLQDDVLSSIAHAYLLCCSQSQVLGGPEPYHVKVAVYVPRQIDRQRKNLHTKHVKPMWHGLAHPTQQLQTWHALPSTCNSAVPVGCCLHAIDHSQAARPAHRPKQLQPPCQWVPSGTWPFKNSFRTMF